MKELFILTLIVLIIFACSSKETQENMLKESFKEQQQEFDIYDALVNDYYCVLLAFKYDMQTKELYEVLKEYEKVRFLKLSFHLFGTGIDSISSKFSIFANKYDIDKKTLANILIDYELLSKEYSGE
ncbi:MAG: hypothetical protein U9R23_07520 [Candidatus Cloacimonadota bacterium]|nr:hypothetical protein [Candidatus Cloacimonadota bacterium]